MPAPSFEGLRVLSLESRRAREMAALITAHGGRPMVAPSMREVPIESNAEALACADAIIGDQFDLVVLLTGVGTRTLIDLVAQARGSRDGFVEALKRTKVAVRGPKPAAVLRELGVPAWVVAPEPNTWRELLAALDGKRDEMVLTGARVAIQEYGVSNPELVAGLEARGARVTPVPVYRWALPEDLAPLHAAIHAVAAAEVDLVLFTTGIQIVHLLEVARAQGLADAVRNGLRRLVIASIGPTTSEELREQGIAVDMEPSHPRMGILVREAAERASELLRSKREDR
jgi:uroporphyrinogen-III synthase